MDRTGGFHPAASLFRRRFLRYLHPLAEAMLILPLAWLYVPLYHPDRTGEMVLLSFGIAVAIWMLLTIFRDRIARLGVLAALTALTLIVDVLLGAPLEKQSVLSYDPIVGARYYGIGNEYMGVLLGSVLLWLNAMHRKQARLSMRGRLTALVLFAGVTYLFAAPTLGTNFGGALAAAVGYTYAMLHFADLRMQARHWAMLGIVTAVVVLSMVLLHVRLPSSEQTHIGRAMHQLLSGQYAAVWQIAVRKLELNFLLLRVSAWGKLFLLFGVAPVRGVGAPQVGRRGVCTICQTQWKNVGSHSVGCVALQRLRRGCGCIDSALRHRAIDRRGAIAE